MRSFVGALTTSGVGLEAADTCELAASVGGLEAAGFVGVLAASVGGAPVSGVPVEAPVSGVPVEVPFFRLTPSPALARAPGAREVLGSLP